MKFTSVFTFVAGSLLLACSGATAFAQGVDDLSPGYHVGLTLAPADLGTENSGGDENLEALAQAAQNPIADMITVPLQNNFNFFMGPNHATQWDLNLQPVIPIRLSDEWNLITRTIVPIINQPSPQPGVPSAFGLGDINPQFYFSPAKPGGLIWGLGPTFTFPTATDPMLGSGKWSAGPAAALLTIQGHWVFGAVANNQWSFAGWGDQGVNAFVVQPFINYNLPRGWYLTTSPIITANWKAGHDNRWTVPVGCGVGKILKLGKQPIDVQFQGFSNIVQPVEGYGADWQLRFQVQFLFPK